MLQGGRFKRLRSGVQAEGRRFRAQKNNTRGAECCKGDGLIVTLWCTSCTCLRALMRQGCFQLTKKSPACDDWKVITKQSKQKKNTLFKTGISLPYQVAF